MNGGLFSTLLDELPESGIGFEDDSLPLLALNTNKERCGLSVTGDDHPVRLCLAKISSGRLHEVH